MQETRVPTPGPATPADPPTKDTAMPRRPRFRYSHFASPRRLRHADRCEDEVSLWTLRALMHGGIARRMCRADDLDADLLRALGIPADAIERIKKESRSVIGIEVKETQALPLLEARLAELERRPPRPCRASRNAALLGKLLDLDSVEVEVLAFALASIEAPLSTCFDALPNGTLAEICRFAAAMLNLAPADVRRALDPDSVLRSIPLVRYDKDCAQPFVPTPALRGPLCQLLSGERDLLRHYVTPAPRSSRSLADFPHFATECDVMVRLLRGARRARARGVNVILYGPPGTGKTELARLLTRIAGFDLFEVRIEDEDGDARVGTARLEALSLSQRMLGGRARTALLMDEAEDAFPQGIHLGNFNDICLPGRRKAWTNTLLEDNPLPTIWISNTLGGIDAAHLRRFDYALEVDSPPRTVRRRILDRHLRGLAVSPEQRASLSEIEEISPGHVQKAARVVRLLGSKSSADTGRDLERVLDGNLRAFTGKRTRRKGATSEVPYDATLLNTMSDLPAIVAGLRRTRTGTACFFGPPGTGKTAFAHHIAHELDRPLLAKRASDLQSMWVGECEKNIARMFEEAERDNAVLLLDEADSFLQDRRGAHRSWEVSRVNEMLTQMETFQGVFICSTNLFEKLDAAALRRFSFKVRFDYMTDAQVLRLLVATLRALGATEEARAVDEPTLRAIARLKRLTPGDFAAVTRQMRVTGEQVTAAGLVRALEQECALKRDTTAKVVGFGG